MSSNKEEKAPEANAIEHGVATGFQAHFKDADDKTQFDIVPIEYRELFNKTFKGATPSEEEYRKWLNSNDIEIISSGHDTIETIDGKGLGFKFLPKARQEIHAYLNTRPMDDLLEDDVNLEKLDSLIKTLDELQILIIDNADKKKLLAKFSEINIIVGDITPNPNQLTLEGIVYQLFENPEDPNPFISKEGIQTLARYLRKKCPRIEAKPLIELMANNGFERYMLKSTPKPENGADTPEKEEESKEEDTENSEK